MAIVYCDANVYNDVERREIGADEVEAFRLERQRGDITVRLGLPDIAEALGAWPKEAATTRERLQIREALAGFKNLVKQPADVFAGAVHAYAAGGPEPSPLLPRPQRLRHAKVFGKIAAGGGAQYARQIAALLAEVK